VKTLRIRPTFGSYYATSATPFGEIVIVWRGAQVRESHHGAIVTRVYVPRNGASPLPQAQREHPALCAGDDAAIAVLIETLVRYLRGEGEAPSLAFADLSLCPAFQRRVLLAEHAVPRGYVTTYGRLAAHLAAPRAARAVGSALANNPFPLLVPCHRALRADLSLGGYQGGLAMKQALLEMEGHTLCDGRVLTGERRLWY